MGQALRCSCIPSIRTATNLRVCDLNRGVGVVMAEKLEQIDELNKAYTIIMQKIRQTSMCAFGGPLNPGARKYTVRNAVERAGLAEEGFFEFHGVQPDGSYDPGKNTVEGAPSQFSATLSYTLVNKEDLNRIYPSASGGWFGRERLPNEIAALVPPMGFRDLNAMTQISFRAADPGAKGKKGKDTDGSAWAFLDWPNQIDARVMPFSEREGQEKAIPLGYIDDQNTRMEPFQLSRDSFDEQIDAYLAYFDELGYSAVRDFDGRTVAKNNQVWQTVKAVGAVVQVIGTIMKLIPVPVVQQVGQVLEIAGQITVFAASAALAGDVFSSSNATQIQP
jgi:hypothetical protein